MSSLVQDISCTLFSPLFISLRLKEELTPPPTTPLITGWCIKRFTDLVIQQCSLGIHCFCCNTPGHVPPSSFWHHWGCQKSPLGGAVELRWCTCTIIVIRRQPAPLIICCMSCRGYLRKLQALYRSFWPRPEIGACKEASQQRVFFRHKRKCYSVRERPAEIDIKLMEEGKIPL